MADKMMRIAGRGEDETAKALHTDNNGNLKTLLAGANKELLTELVMASFRKDADGLGLMRVYLENKLSATDGDSVGLDGVLANRLLRMPSEELLSYSTNRTMLSKDDESYAERVLLDTRSHIDLTTLQVVTWNAVSNLAIFVYDHTGSGSYERVATKQTYNTGALSLQELGETQAAIYSHPQYSVKLVDSTTKTWEFANRNGMKITFPYGCKIFLRNTTTTPYNYAYVIKYQKYEVML